MTSVSQESGAAAVAAELVDEGEQLLQVSQQELDRLLAELQEVGYGEVARSNPERGEGPEAYTVVIRESAKWDRRLLRQMGIQTLRPLVEVVPGAATVLEGFGEGFLAFEQGAAGAAWRAEHCARAVPLRERGGRQYGWKLLVEGSWFVIAATSARSTDVEEDFQNPFTRDLTAHIAQERVDRLWAGPFTRLVRRASLGAQLQEAFEAANDHTGLTVHIKEYPSGIEFKNTAAGMTGLLWGLLGTIAEQEVRMSTLRMLLGRIVQVEDNRWERDDQKLPPHVTLDEDRRLVAATDPARIAEAQAWVRIAARAHDDALDPQQVVELLATDPEVRATVQSGKNAGRPLTAHTNPLQAITSRFDWLRAMRTGVYMVPQALPFDGCTPDDVLGKKVYRRTVELPGGVESSKDYIVLTWRFPVVTGIDDATWDKALAYRESLQTPPQIPTEGPQQVRPFSGIFTGTAVRDGHVRRLVSSRGDYTLYEAPAGTPIRDGDIIASITGPHLANAIVSPVLSAARAGALPIALEQTTVTRRRRTAPPPASPAVQAATATRDAIQAQIDQRQGWLDTPGFPEAARDEVRQQLDALHGDLTAAQRHLDAATAANSATADATADQEHLATLADLLAYLSATGGAPAPAAIRRMVADHILDATIDAQPHSPWVEGSFRLLVRTGDGDVAAGPFHFTAPNSARGFRRDRHNRVRRDLHTRVHQPELLRLLCVDGYALHQLAANTGSKPRTLQRNLRRLLAGDGHYTPVVADANAASAWIDLPPPLRAALYSYAHHQQLLPWSKIPELADRPVPPPPATLDGLDEDDTARYLHHLANTVLRTTSWPVPAYSRGGERDLRAGLQHVLHTPAPTLSSYAHAFGWSAHTGAAGRSAFNRHQGVLVVWDDPTADNPNLSPRRCPRCHHTLHVLAAIDVPEQVLCPSCRTMPDTPDLRFPDTHFRLLEGPYGNTTAKNRGTPATIAGTREGELPPVPTAWRRTATKHAPGHAARASRVRGQCRFNPDPDGDQQHRCPNDRAPGAISYCPHHTDRTQRAADTRDHQRRHRQCRRDGCTNQPAPAGRGRPPVYCNTCRQLPTGQRQQPRQP